jgi:integrase
MIDMANVDQMKKRHAVRHTYATFLISYANANDSELMDLGGWKTRDMISVYGSTVPEETRKKINLLP